MSTTPDTLSARFKGDPRTDADWAAWEEKLSLGEEPSKAAKELGFTVSGYRRADPDRHKTALEKGRQARAEFVDERVEIWIDEENASPAIRQAWMKRWNPAYAERQQVELTGADGGPMEVTSPDVTDAVERFTAALVPLAERGRTSAAPDVAE